MSTEENPLPWPTPFELEMRAAVSRIEAHQLRQDRLIIDHQIEWRNHARLQAEKMDELNRLLKKLTTNGGGDHA